MLKVVQINITCGMGSTGQICVAVSDLLTKVGIENYILYTSGYSDHPAGKKYMSATEVKIQALKSRVTGNYGFQSKKATERLIAELDRIEPDIVYLHNLHGHNVHLEYLFQYFKSKKTKLFWTFHDCWSLTGYCPHYDMIGCDKWKMGCHACPQKSHYSWFFDRSGYLYEKKKQLFAGLDLTIVTPSKWMAEQVKMSFLKDYSVQVVHNGIDLSVFSPKKSNFREKYGIGNKYIVLGVAFDWGVRKGLDVFEYLAENLNSDIFQIVLVGTNLEIDKKLPQKIISVHRTVNQTELAEIYTSADVFLNPTREEVLGLTNIESLACGTPVITFSTGGSVECVDETCGIVVEKNDIDSLLGIISDFGQIRKLTKENCIRKAMEFNASVKYQEYVEMILNAR